MVHFSAGNVTPGDGPLAQPVGPPTAIAQTRGRFCPCCNRHSRRGFEPGPDGRPDAKCPRCRSLERHRFFAVLLGVLRPQLGDVGVLLDVAPAPQARLKLSELEPRNYVRLDLKPARKVDLLGSLTQLPLRDRCVDLLVCYHVLEHIPDDRAAIAEIARVIASDGLGILQVPWRPHMATDEDPDASDEEKIRRFALADHVRYYGLDFEDRLAEAGLDVTRVTPADLLGHEANTLFGLGQWQSVWLVRPVPEGEGRVRSVPEMTPLAMTFEAVVGDLAKARSERREAREEVRGLRAELERLRAESETRGRRLPWKR